MSGNDRGDCSETNNNNSAESSVKSCIRKLIEDLERDIQRIDDKIATICGGTDKGDAEEAHALEDKCSTVNVVAAFKEVDPVAESEKNVSQAKAEVVLHKIVLEDTVKAGIAHLLEPTIQGTSNQQTDADADDWAAFISERAAISLTKSEIIDLTKSEAEADCSSNVDGDWDDFFRERAGVAVVDSDATEDGVDEFFNDSVTMDKYKHHTKSGKLRKLVKRIFRRH